MLRTWRAPSLVSLAPTSGPAIAALWMCVGVAPVTAQPLCKPAIAISETGFSEVVHSRRFWRAKLNVDASRCASASGNFSIGFVRLSETAPDLEFAELLAWHAGRMDVVVEFAAEEAVDKYWINTIAPCTCRGD